jgi:hypothetical protein
LPVGKEPFVLGREAPVCLMAGHGKRLAQPGPKIISGFRSSFQERAPFRPQLLVHRSWAKEDQPSTINNSKPDVGEWFEDRFHARDSFVFFLVLSCIHLCLLGRSE